MKIFFHSGEGCSLNFFGWILRFVWQKSPWNISLTYGYIYEEYGYIDDERGYIDEKCGYIDEELGYIGEERGFIL